MLFDLCPMTCVVAFSAANPVLLDELLSSRLVENRPDWPQQAAELAAELDACDGAEAKMDVLRRFRHAHAFRLAVQDLAGKWTVEAVSDQLSALADTILAAALEHAMKSTMPSVRARKSTKVPNLPAFDSHAS